MSDARSVTRRIAGLLRAELPHLAAATFLLFVGSAAVIAYPQGIRIIVDSAVHVRDPATVRRTALALLGLAILQGLATGGRYVLFARAGERGLARLRNALYQSLVVQEIAFFDETRTGDLTSRLGNDTAALQGLLSSSVSTALRHTAVAAGAIAFLAVTSPRLTVLMLAIVPPVAIGVVLGSRKLRSLSRRYQDALAEASHVAEESFSAIRTVRAFVAEEQETARYAGAVGLAYVAARKRALIGGGFAGATTAAVYTAAAVIIGYGGRLVALGEMTPGTLTAFLVYTLLIATSTSALADLWTTAMRGVGAAERVFELLDRVPVMPVTGGERPERALGRIAFEEVGFAYPSRPEVQVLEGVQFAIEPGERVALVGSSGAGKSTVAALLCRLYDPTRGRIVLDGRDLTRLDSSWLRSQIGVVAQEPVLFSASVEENIRYGRPGAAFAEVEAASRAAHADGFIRALPKGYDTRVGERGQQLSGGQRQRIAIARALLKNPRILLLDEATSALDSESEGLVQDALERLMRGPTSIVIAHRLSTVARADRVLVLERGRIVESGRPDLLLAQGGFYRRLVERQVLLA